MNQIRPPATFLLKSDKFRWAIVMALLSAPLAAGSLMYAMHRGVGLENDAIDYVATAQSLLAGRGLKTLGSAADWVPLRNFPPGYPLILAAAGWFTGDVVKAARYVQAGAFGLTAAVMLLACFMATRSLLVSALAAAVVLGVLVNPYTMALSEGTFLCVALPALWSMAQFIRTGKRGWLLMAAIGFAVAIVIRFAGLSLVAAAGIAMLWLGRRSVLAASRGWRGTLLDLILLGAIAAVPMVICGARSSDGGAGVGGRRISFHPPEARQYHTALTVIAQLISPIGKKTGPLKNDSPVTNGEWIAVAELLLLTALSAYYFSDRQRRQRFVAEIFAWPGAELIAVMACFVAIYMPFLWFSLTFIDHNGPNFRVMCPMVAPAILVVVGVLTAKLAGGGRVGLSRAAVALLALCVLLRGYRTAQSAQEMHHDGISLGTAKWQNSQTLQQARALPAATLIYTNAPDVLYLLGGRMSRTLPGTVARKIAHIHDADQVRAAVGDLGRELAKNDGVIVYFDNMHREDFLATKKQLSDNLAVAPYVPPPFSAPPADGVLWKVKPAAP